MGSRRLLLQLLPQLLLQLLLHLLLQLLLQLLLRLLLQFLLQLLQLLAQLVVQLLVQLLLQPQPCTQLSPGPKTTSAREEGRPRRYRTAGMTPFINTRAPGGPGGREWCAFSIHCALLGRPEVLDAAPAPHTPVPGS